jgi:hypothetical protein
MDGDVAMVWAGPVSTTTLPTVESVRWGIIGVGNVTEAKSGPGFQRAERSELVAVMRRNGDLAADYARRHDVPRWYDDADELINDPEVDAVYVATPPDSHREYVVRVAQAGKPVYVEKPMARTALEFGTAGALRFSCFDDDPLRLLTARGVEQVKAPYPETVQLPSSSLWSMP